MSTSPDFFPPDSPNDRHAGIQNEILQGELLLNTITDEASYQAAYSEGFLDALDFLLHINIPPSDFGPSHIRLLHQVLFKQLYKQPGQMRAQGFQALFGGRIGTDSHLIEKDLEQLIQQSRQILSNWQFAPTTAEGALERIEFIAFYHARLILIHPFRDGNGRLSRLISQWQELQIFGFLPFKPVSRVFYISALEMLPHEFAPMVTYYCYRFPGNTNFPSVTIPPFPVKPLRE